MVLGDRKCSTSAGQLVVGHHGAAQGKSTTINGQQWQMQEAASAAVVVTVKISRSPREAKVNDDPHEMLRT